MMGYTDLNTQKIDYTMLVAPQITSSIPVIVAWLVNPATGLAVLAIDQVLHSARVISEIEYTITGTLDEPVVTLKGKNSREIELPEAEFDTPQETQPDSKETSDTQSTEPTAENVTTDLTPKDKPLLESVQ
jgi:hypothetical protein